MRQHFRFLRPATWLAPLVLMGVLVFPAPSAHGQAMQQALDTLATNMGQRLVREGSGTLTLIVADLPSLKGDYCGMGRFVAERMTTQLAGTKGIKVLERSQLAQALLEMKLAQADLADPEKAKEVGLRIGAEDVVLGGVSDLGTSVELDLRVLRLASGETLFSGYAAFAKTEAIDGLLRRDCGRGNPPADAAAGAPAVEPTENTGKEEKALTSSEPVYENSAYKISFEAVRKTGTSVAATVVLEAVGQNPIKLALRNNAYLIDENGDRWDQAGPDSASFWAWGDVFALPELIPGIKRRTKLVFKANSPNSQGTVFTLVAKEYRPQEGRMVSVANIKAERELIQTR